MQKLVGFLTALFVLAACGQMAQSIPDHSRDMGLVSIGLLNDAAGTPCMRVYLQPSPNERALTDAQKQIVLNENRQNFCVAGKIPQAVVELYNFHDGGGDHYFTTGIHETRRPPRIDTP